MVSFVDAQVRAADGMVSSCPGVSCVMGQPTEQAFRGLGNQMCILTRGSGFPLQVTPVVLCRPLVIRTRLLLRAGGFSSSQLKLGFVSNLRLACKGPNGERSSHYLGDMERHLFCFSGIRISYTSFYAFAGLTPLFQRRF